MKFKTFVILVYLATLSNFVMYAQSKEGTSILVRPLNVRTKIFVDSSKSRIKPVTFDSTKWIGGDKLVRGSMVDDIINRKLLVQKSRVEIIRLLGKPDYSYPDYVFYFVDNGSHSEDIQWMYYFVIEFDSSDIMRTVRWND